MNGIAIAIIVVTIVGVGIVACIQAAQAAQVLESAKQSYEGALRALERNPENNSRRQDALKKGRAYAALARKKAGSEGVALFDEVALSNDLSARMGSASGNADSAGTKDCPQCAETVKAAAAMCRFCGHSFSAAGHSAPLPSQDYPAWR